MSTLIVTLIVMILMALALSISVLVGRKPVTGACGGVGRALGQSDYVCELCGDDEAKCEAEKLRNINSKEVSDLSYDASKRNK